MIIRLCFIQRIIYGCAFDVSVYSRHSPSGASTMTHHWLSEEVFANSLKSIGTLSWLRISEALTLDYNLPFFLNKNACGFENFWAICFNFNVHGPFINNKYFMKCIILSRIISISNHISEFQYFLNFLNEKLCSTAWHLLHRVLGLWDVGCLLSISIKPFLFLFFFQPLFFLFFSYRSNGVQTMQVVKV